MVSTMLVGKDGASCPQFGHSSPPLTARLTGTRLAAP
jgi:hypothetical protein